MKSADAGLRWLKVAGKVVLGIVLAFVLWVAVLVVIDFNKLGSTYQVSDKETVRYMGKATEDEARRVADALRESGYFDNTKTLDVILRKDEGAPTTLSFVVGGNWNTPKVIDDFTRIGRRGGRQARRQAECSCASWTQT